MISQRIRVFQAVAAQLSFSRAAQELSISQPGVTFHVKSNEIVRKTRATEDPAGQIHAWPPGIAVRDSALVYRGWSRPVIPLVIRERSRLSSGCPEPLA